MIAVGCPTVIEQTHCKEYTPMYDTPGRIRPMVSQTACLLVGDGKVNQQSYRNL